MITRLDAWFWLYEWPNARINWRPLFLLTQMTKCGHVYLEMVIKQNFLLHLACLAQSLTWRLILRKMVTKSTSRYTFYCSHVNLKNYCIMMFLLLTNILLVFIMYITCILLIMSHPLCYCVVSVLIIIVNILITMMWNITIKKQSSLQMSCNLTLYTLISVSIISLLFTIHFPRCWQREFAQ